MSSGWDWTLVGDAAEVELEIWGSFYEGRWRHTWGCWLLRTRMLACVSECDLEKAIFETWENYILVTETNQSFLFDTQKWWHYRSFELVTVSSSWQNNMSVFVCTSSMCIWGEFIVLLFYWKTARVTWYGLARFQRSRASAQGRCLAQQHAPRAYVRARGGRRTAVFCIFLGFFLKKYPHLDL